MKSKLSTNRAEVQQRYKTFAHAFVRNGQNATRSAIEAGYSEKNAAAQGWVLVRNKDVQRYITQYRGVDDPSGNVEIAVALVEWEDLFDACMGKKDYSNAARCRENICKIKGLYEADNVQQSPLTIIVHEAHVKPITATTTGREHKGHTPTPGTQESLSISDLYLPIQDKREPDYALP